jgi:hypothetical protein
VTCDDDGRICHCLSESFYIQYELRVMQQQQLLLLLLLLLLLVTSESNNALMTVHTPSSLGSGSSPGAHPPPQASSFPQSALSRLCSNRQDKLLKAGLATLNLHNAPYTLLPHLRLPSMQPAVT